eukprot:CAMPEP_0197531044 /NCGR_PEP_ID=MMETSP1318-20131121/33890_1 /TAXON_ID=552666 /ORGANISM="Partenskyella glossopodia, Strain RCC365" /LENGTH=490 /DNA_ID=CAMNT_0043087115 /DNA_START=147 /DNA_END=1619 /DNA_ORIENTATION=+
MIDQQLPYMEARHRAFNTTFGHLVPEGAKIMKCLGRELKFRYNDLMCTSYESCRREEPLVFTDPTSERDKTSALAFMEGFYSIGNYSLYDSITMPQGDLLNRMENDDPMNVERACGMPEYSDQKTPKKSLEIMLKPTLQKLCRMLLGQTSSVSCPISSAAFDARPAYRKSATPWRPFGGVLAEASPYVEVLLMQYLSGHNSTQGNLVTNANDVNDIIRIQQALFNAIGYEIAQNFGSELLVHIAASLLKNTNLPHSSYDIPLYDNSARVLIHFSHDSNLHFLRELLRLKWTSEGWLSNFAAPGDMLAFELYKIKEEDEHNQKTHYYIKIAKLSMGPDTQRAISKKKAAKKQNRMNKMDGRYPVSAEYLAIWGCDTQESGSGFECPLEEFVELVLKAIKPKCVENSDLKAILTHPSLFDIPKSITTVLPSGVSGNVAGRVAMVILAGLGSMCTLGLLYYMLFRKRSRSCLACVYGIAGRIKAVEIRGSKQP